jgi:hypothetical protein
MYSVTSNRQANGWTTVAGLAGCSKLTWCKKNRPTAEVKMDIRSWKQANSLHIKQTEEDLYVVLSLDKLYSVAVKFDCLKTFLSIQFLLTKNIFFCPLRSTIQDRSEWRKHRGSVLFNWHTIEVSVLNLLRGQLTFSEVMTSADLRL